MTDDNDDFSKLSLGDKLAHKAWKARVSGYEELAKLLASFPTSDDPKYKSYVENMKAISMDANAVALENGLSAISSFISNSNLTAKVRPLVLSNIIEKGLNGNRTSMKQKSLDLIMLFVEVDVAGPVIDELISFFNHKQPKLVTASINACLEITRSFGTRVVDIKPLIKAIPKMFSHADKNVRSEASKLVVEIYRWIGASIDPFLESLTPIQKSQLQEEFSKLPAEKPKPLRYRRVDQEQSEANPNEGDEESGNPAEIDDGQVDNVDEPVAIDSYDLADPVSVLAKLPENFYENLASSKWKERKEALDAFLPELKVPKIADDRYGELVAALAKRLNDSNILIGLAAANCIEALAKGMRKGFASYKSLVMSNLLERLKEKKANIIEGFRVCLDAIFESCSIKDILDDVASVSNHKNPQVKLESLKWLVRSLCSSKDVPGKSEIKAIADLSKNALNDGFGDVRDTAAECLGTISKIVGERVMIQHLSEIDPIKMAKIKEFEEKAVIKAKPQKTAPVKKVSKSNVSVADKENSPPLTTAKPRPAPTKVAVKKSSSNVSVNKPKSMSSSSSSISGAAVMKKPSIKEVISLKYSLESATNFVEEIYSAQVIADLSDANWKTRLAAIDIVQSKIESLDQASSVAEPHLQFLCSKLFKDSNFQVLGKLLSIIQYISDSWPSFDKACATVAIGGLLEKLGDVKQKKASSDCLLSFSEKVSMGFVFSQAYEPIKIQKSPKIQADQIKWLQTALNEFGAVGVNVKDLLELLKTTLGSSNAMVRTSSISTLGTLRLLVGPEVRTLLQDISPHLLSSIDAEFEKVAAEKAPKPTRVQIISSAEANEAVEELIQRTDISSQLTPKVLQKWSDPNWKVRLEGIEEVKSILEAANLKIKPNLGDLPTELKNRLNDSNKNLVTQTLEIVAVIANSMGKPFERYCRLLGSHVLNCLADNKAQIRTITIKVLDSIYDNAGIEALIPCFAASLMTDNPNLRKEGLKWLSEKLSAKVVSDKADVSSLVSPLITCLLDRLPDIRKSALSCLEIIAETVGYEFIREKTQDLKAASLQSVMSLIEGLKRGSSNIVKSSSATSHTPSKSNIGRSRSASSTTAKKATSSASMTNVNQANNVAPAVSSAVEEFPIKLADPKSKESRSDKDRGVTKWNYEPDRRDLVELLKEQSDSCFASSLNVKLYSEDFKDHISALTDLENVLVEKNESRYIEQYGIDFEHIQGRVIGCLDVIFKYFSVRSFDTNTTVALKLLDVLEKLIALLDKIDYHLSEYEASALVPYLISKTGDAKEVIRTRVRSLLKLLGHVYPSSKIFQNLLDAIKSKNARVRSECLDEIATLFERNGLSITIPAKSIPLIGSHISDRDANVRNAALKAIVQAYFIDESVKGYLKLNEKDSSLLDERIKRSSKVSSVTRSSPLPSSKSASIEMMNDSQDDNSSTPVNKRKMQPSSTQVSAAVVSDVKSDPSKPFTLDIDTLDLPKLSDTATADPSKMITAVAPQKYVSATPFLSERARSKSSAFIIDYLSTQLVSEDPVVSVDALKELSSLIVANEDAVATQINQIVYSVTLQLHLSFKGGEGRSSNSNVNLSSVETESSPSSAIIRLRKHVVTTLVQLFSVKNLASKVPMDTLQMLLEELIVRLLDEKSGISETGQQLAKVINVLMLRIFENCDKNHIYTILLKKLGQTSFALISSGSSSNQGVAEAKVTELVMKCLWKITKSLKENVAESGIKVNSLLLDIHNFLVEYPPAEWKKRVAAQVPLSDMPLKTVKTILHELVVGLSDKVLNYVDLIESPEKSYVSTYLNYMLEASKKNKGSEDASTSINGGTSGNALAKVSGATLVLDSPVSDVKRATIDDAGMSLAMNTTVAPDLTETQVNAILTKIFKTIGSKEETKRGLSELFDFIRDYAQWQSKVELHLSKTGSFFQGYIKRGLANIAMERKAPIPDLANPQSKNIGKNGISTNPSSSSDAGGESAVEYKEKLVKLQEMFGLKKSESESPAATQDLLDISKPLVQSSNEFDKQLSSKSDSNENGTAAPTAGKKSDLLKLKERLAQIRTAGNTTTVNANAAVYDEETETY